MRCIRWHAGCRVDLLAHFRKNGLSGCLVGLESETFRTLKMGNAWLPAEVECAPEKQSQSECEYTGCFTRSSGWECPPKSVVLCTRKSRNVVYYGLEPGGILGGRKKKQSKMELLSELPEKLLGRLDKGGLALQYAYLIPGARCRS